MIYRRDIRSLLYGCAVLVCIGPAAFSGDNTEHLFPGLSDSHTAALWLFDEPETSGAVPQEQITRWYYTQTLTDASRNHFDLHRLNGSQISKGRFGNALRVLPGQVGNGMGLPANFATVPRVYGVFLPADHEFVPRSDEEANSQVNFFWYTHKPGRLLAALAGDQWTIEMWLRLETSAGEVTTLVDAGQGNDLSLRVDLEDGGRVVRIRNAEAGIDVKCPLPSRLQSSKWYHLAWVKPPDRDQVLQFQDGKLLSASDFAVVGKPELPQRPGLIAQQFGTDELADPLGVTPLEDRATLGQTISESAKSIRLRGWVRAPYTGVVRFSTDPDCGLHLSVDHSPLIYGWFGRAKRYRRSPRWGEVQMVADRIYPVLIDAAIGGEDGVKDSLPLYWSWHARDRAPIPASAWAHTTEDLVAAQADGGGMQPDTLMKLRFNCVLGSDRSGNHALDGWIDEMRISSHCRYSGNFTPETHSLVQRRPSITESKPTGPPLVFSEDARTDVIPLGARKHLFIDDALIDKSEGLRFEVNPPRNPIAVEPRLPSGDHSFFELDGKVALFAPAGYEGREDYAHLWLSDDGIQFRQYESATSAAGQPAVIDTRVNAWGRMAIDPNPMTPDWARFKYTAGVPHRGIYLLVSPDAVHWRRHETILLQVGTGGESHWYWDDQAGLYRYVLKWDHGPGGRQAVEAVSRTLFTPFQLPPSSDDRLGLMTPDGFMPTRFAPDETLGQVYRTRVTKYRGAPDTYLAFLWRFDRPTMARQVELAVSRDGEKWKYFGTDWYMPAEFDFQGQRIREVTSVDGLIERGDEVWQYADYSTGRHDSSAPYWRVRLLQRLDGFVALTDGGKGGSFTSKPIHFSGKSLVVNASVADEGHLKVAFLDDQSRPISGFGLKDCDPISGDSVRHKMTWGGESDTSSLAGRPIRIRIQMANARLFALEFANLP